MTKVFHKICKLEMELHLKVYQISLQKKKYFLGFLVKILKISVILIVNLAFINQKNQLGEL